MPNQEGVMLAVPRSATTRRAASVAFRPYYYAALPFHAGTSFQPGCDH
jgi:hypothetical protein